MTRRPRRSLLAATVTSLVLLVALVGPAAASGPKVSVIAHGLDNPRGLAIGSDGRVFVAAAGKGGTGGYGTTGKIVRDPRRPQEDVQRRPAVDHLARG